MKRTTLSLILSLCMGLATLAALVAAQGPTPEPLAAEENILAVTPEPVEVAVVTPAEPDSSPTDAVLVTMPDGDAGVAVEIPANAEAEEVVAIAETSAETQRDVASGDVPVAQATRPLENTSDPGANDLIGQLFWYLSFLFGAWFRPQVVGRIRKAWPASWPPITDKYERWMNAGLQLAFFAAAFYPLHGLSTSLPQTLGGWLRAAGVSIAGASTLKRSPDAATISQSSVPPLVPTGQRPIR